MAVVTAAAAAVPFDPAERVVLDVAVVVVVAVVDSVLLLLSQLQELMCHVMMGNLVMFRKDSVLNILS